MRQNNLTSEGNGDKNQEMLFYKEQIGMANLFRHALKSGLIGWGDRNHALLYPTLQTLWQLRDHPEYLGFKNGRRGTAPELVGLNVSAYDEACREKVKNDPTRYMLLSSPADFWEKWGRSSREDGTPFFRVELLSYWWGVYRNHAGSDGYVVPDENTVLTDGILTSIAREVRHHFGGEGESSGERFALLLYTACRSFCFIKHPEAIKAVEEWFLGSKWCVAEPVEHITSVIHRDPRVDPSASSSPISLLANSQRRTDRYTEKQQAALTYLYGHTLKSGVLRAQNPALLTPVYEALWKLRDHPYYHGYPNGKRGTGPALVGLDVSAYDESFRKKVRDQPEKFMLIDDDEKMKYFLSGANMKHSWGGFKLAGLETLSQWWKVYRSLAQKETGYIVPCESELVTDGILTTVAREIREYFPNENPFQREVLALLLYTSAHPFPELTCDSAVKYFEGSRETNKKWQVDDPVGFVEKLIGRNLKINERTRASTEPITYVRKGSELHAITVNTALVSLAYSEDCPYERGTVVYPMEYPDRRSGNDRVVLTRKEFGDDAIGFGIIGKDVVRLSDLPLENPLDATREVLEKALAGYQSSSDV